MSDGREFPDERSWAEIESAALAVLEGRHRGEPFSLLGHESIGDVSVVALRSDQPVADTRHLIEIDCSDRSRPTVTSIASGAGGEVPLSGRALLEAEGSEGAVAYSLIRVRPDVAWIQNDVGRRSRRVSDQDIVLVVSEAAPFVVTAVSQDGRALGSLRVLADDDY